MASLAFPQGEPAFACEVPAKKRTEKSSQLQAVNVNATTTISMQRRCKTRQYNSRNAKASNLNASTELTLNRCHICLP